MTQIQADSAPETANDEYRPRRRRKRIRSSGSRQRRRRIRLIYFSLASLWGFLIGAAAVLVAPKVLESMEGMTTMVPWVLAASSVLALAGGGFASRAYREAVGRGGR